MDKNIKKGVACIFAISIVLISVVVVKLSKSNNSRQLSAAATYHYSDEYYKDFGLGYGYDVINSPAWRGGNIKTMPILNVDALIKDNALAYNMSRESNIKVITGKNIEEYTKAMAVEAGADATVGFFSGNASLAVKNNSDVSNSHEFASISIEERTGYQHIMNAYLEDYFSPQFKKAIASMTPAKILKEFGTHVLTGVGLGGKIIASYDVNNAEKKNSHSIKTALEAKISACFGSGESSLSVEDSAINNYINKNSSINIQTEGGRTKGIDVTSGIDALIKNLQGWRDSVGRLEEMDNSGQNNNYDNSSSHFNNNYNNNSNLFNAQNIKLKNGKDDAFNDTVSFIGGKIIGQNMDEFTKPIWELIEDVDSAKATEVENLFYKNLDKAGKSLGKIQKPKTYIKSIIVASGTTEDRAKSEITREIGNRYPKSPYKLLDYNAGPKEAGTPKDYPASFMNYRPVYVASVLTTDKDEAITNIKTAFSLADQYSQVKTIYYYDKAIKASPAPADLFTDGCVVNGSFSKLNDKDLSTQCKKVQYQKMGLVGNAVILISTDKIFGDPITDIGFTLNNVSNANMGNVDVSGVGSGWRSTTNNIFMYYRNKETLFLWYTDI
jgi:hypothetical protein